MNTRSLLPLLLLLLPACPSSTDEAADDEAGFETGPCIDDNCFQGLTCLSDVCVDEGGTAGESGNVTNPSSASQSSASDPATTEPDPTEDPTKDPTEDPTEDPTMDLGTTSDTSSTTDPGETDEGRSSSTTGPQGCGDIDFLFVVDNSGSMEDDQANLIANFPVFIESIQNALTTVEGVHVGVVTTDAYVGNAADCRVLGGLVTQTAGSSSSNAVCGPYEAGNNFITEADDIADAFACAAQVGVSGDGIERPMEAMQSALSDELGGSGQCNEGFLRDEALLVIVVITDEWDGPGDPESAGSAGDATSWFDAVVAAKNGNQENIVAVTLTHINGGSCPPQDVFFNPAHIQTFVEMFGENGVAGCITSDFSTTFSDATTVIENACSNFVE